MNILCDLISARQGFNKQQENFFSPSIPSSLALHIPSNHWHHEVNRTVEPQRRWNGAVIGSSSEPKLRSSQEGLCVHTTLQLIGSIKEWIYPPVISAVVSLYLLLFPLSFYALLLWIKVRMWGEKVCSIVERGRYVGKCLEIYTAPSGDCPSVKHWFKDTK